MVGFFLARFFFLRFPSCSKVSVGTPCFLGGTYLDFGSCALLGGRSFGNPKQFFSSLVG